MAAVHNLSENSVAARDFNSNLNQHSKVVNSNDPSNNQDDSNSTEVSPPPIPHVTNNFISLRTVISNLVLFTHKELRNLLETLPATTSDNAKKRRLLDFLVKIRIQFVKVYVLTKWAKVSKDISKTIDVVSWLTSQQNCFHNVILTLFTIEKDLGGAKLRAPDIETALEVFTAGRPSLPSLGFFPQKKLDSATVLQTLHDLDILLSIRLALTEKLPPKFSHYKIADGRVTFFVENCYQVQVGIADDSVDARFFLVDFKFDFPGAFRPSELTKARLESAANDILAKRGLEALFETLLTFTQNYKLSTYHLKVLELSNSIYSGLISSKFYPDKSLVTINYWLHPKTRTSRNFINIGILKQDKQIGISWIRDGQLVLNHNVEFGHPGCSVKQLLQDITSCHVQHIVTNVFNSLARYIELGNASQSNAHNSNDSNNDNSSSSNQQRSIYLQPPNSYESMNSPQSQSPSAQTASTPNTPASDLQGPNSENYYSSDVYGYEIVSLISPEKIKIMLTGTKFTIFSVDRLTGKTFLTNPNKLIASFEAIINEVYGRTNAIAELLIKLRLSSIQDEICSKAKATGLIAKTNMPIHSSVVRTKFPPHTRIIFCLRDSSWPAKWFLLVSLNTNGIPKWWISQTVLKDGYWSILFSEELSISHEINQKYTYQMFDELNTFIINRIRTEALRKQLDRFKVNYRLIQSDNTNADDNEEAIIDEEEDDNSSNQVKDSLPIAILDLPSICGVDSQWAEDAIYMHLDSQEDNTDTINVLIYGKIKESFDINTMPRDDPCLTISFDTGKYTISLVTSSISIPVNTQSKVGTQTSELIENIREKFAQVERIASHVNLLKNLSLNILEASMSKITFEYAPSLVASLILPERSNETGYVKSEGKTPNTSNTGSNNKQFILELKEDSPHKIVAHLLQEVLNNDGLLPVVWAMKKALPLYLALQELMEKGPKPLTIADFLPPDENGSNTNGIKKQDGSTPFEGSANTPGSNGVVQTSSNYSSPTNIMQSPSVNMANTPSSSTSSSTAHTRPIIIIAHSLLDFTIQFVRSPRRIYLQLKLIESNGRPLQVFVSEAFLYHPFLSPVPTGPMHATHHQQLQQQLNTVSPPKLVNLWRQKVNNTSNNNNSGDEPSSKSEDQNNNNDLKIPRGVVPLQQGLSCPIESIQEVMRLVYEAIMG